MSEENESKSLPPWAIALAAGVLSGGGVGIGTDLLPGQNDGVPIATYERFVESNNAALGDIRTQLIQMQNTRDETHERDHLYIGCVNGRIDCGWIKDIPSDEDD